MIVATERGSYEVYRARQPYIAVLRINSGSSLCPYEITCPEFYAAIADGETEAAEKAAQFAIKVQEVSGVFASRA